ncbi:GATOR complex protein MIOS-B-like [Oppia nitens]|uniref:GATOR complex protein MIOS-B-like n=1 Tax=Oppia nitens TaxID=1686743 RepID=UPI0023DC0EE6|nr:GATOR complex protein MIOS-B-like [Oppia nitens]
MSLIKIDINWSPIADRFITFGNDLKLFQCETIAKESPKSFAGTQLSDKIYANIIATNSEIQFVKCIAINPKPIHSENDVLLATGHTSGKVLLTSFHYNPDNTGVIGREFVPKHARQCNCLDWSLADTNLLSAGFDRIRNDYAVLVWDVQRKASVIAMTESYSPKPLHELAFGELTHSLKWLLSHKQAIICGMNNKHLKLFDLRDSGKPLSTITKAVHGLALDPIYDNRFSSYFENYIYVWDIRNIEKPVTTIGPEPKPIVKIEWSPTRSNMLASLIKDGTGIKLFDIKDYVNANNDLEPAIIDRIVNPFDLSNKSKLSSFSWHPTHESRMIFVTPSGTLRDFTVVDRITLNWSPVSEIIWTHGKKILQCIDSRDTVYESIDDIAVKMRKLALDGYGLSNDKLWQMFPNDTTLYNVWKWIESHLVDKEKNTSLLAKNLITNEEDLINSQDAQRLYGVRSILMESDTKLKIQSEVVIFHNESKSFDKNLSNNIIKKYYKSNDRRKALLHCGWDTNFDSDSQNARLVQSLVTSGQFTRAAAVLIFGGGKIKKAINTLKMGAEVGKDKSFNAIALALSGYTRDRNSLWCEMCHSIQVQLSDPYLRAIFTFLTTDSETYSEILYKDSLDIADRIAFACIYLSDQSLCEYINYLTQTMIESGNLRGIIVTGITNEGLDLFARYIELTTDVQTISLILLKALPSAISQSPRAKMWTESYRQLLDCWRLWNIRAQFDIDWYKGLCHLKEPKQQIFVSCNYCGFPISSYISQPKTVKAQEQYQQQLSHHHHNRSSSTTSSIHKNRIQSCPQCRKPLPRCALCLTHLGTPGGQYWRPGLTFNKSERKLTPFNSWFTWCQTCRHGGHANHIIQWFNEHINCPVAGCECKCMSLDANSKLSSNLPV